MPDRRDGPPSADRSVFRAVLPIVRPPRYAIGVASDTTMELLARLAQGMTATWGAARSTVVFPVDHWSRSSLWNDILDRCDADIFLFCTESLDEVTVQERYDPLWTFTDPALFRAGSFGGPGATPLKTALHVLEDGGLTDPSFQVHEATNAPPWLRLASAVHAGVIPDFDRDSYPGLNVTEYDVSNAGEAFDFLRRAIFEPVGNRPNTVNEWALMPLTETYEVGAPPVVVVGSGTTDVCLWLALRMLSRRAIHWLPSEADGIGTLPEFYRRLLADSLQDSFSRGGHRQHLVTSSSLDDSVAMAIAGRLSPSVGGGLLVPKWVLPSEAVKLLTRSWTAMTRHEALYREEFREGVAHRLVEIPMPGRLAEVPSTAGLQFLVELRVEGTTYPTHQGVRPLLEDTTEQRSGRYGVVFDPLPLFRSSGDKLIHAVRRPSLNLPSADETVRRLGQYVGGEAGPSESGLRLRAVAERFGGPVATVRALLVGPLAPIWKDHRSGEKQRGRYKMSDRRVAWTDECLKAIDPAANDGWLSEMCGRDVLHSGLVLKCASCARLDFYWWSDLGQDRQHCRYCRSSLPVDPDHSPCWAPLFTLDPVLIQVLESDGLEELALAALLETEAKRHAVSLGTLWIVPGIGSVEVDVVGTLDGLTTVGEAKSVDAVVTKQTTSVTRLADKIQARQVVFATSRASWDSATEARLRATATSASGFTVRLITDLLEAARNAVSS